MKKLLLQLSGSTLLFLISVFIFSLPAPLFSDPVSDILLASDSTLLGARIASDGQWRFPPQPEVPAKFKEALITFEDQRFDHHPGVDPIALIRATGQNISGRKIKSGGSTLTMQVIRLHRKGKPRILYEKAIEAWTALRLECSYSKKEILSLYASYAPFGGNVVGLEAAAWRYFGRPSISLSWAECATLAVLPNAPALIHPGRNRDALKRKRDFLLRKLWKKGAIDRITYELSVDEPLPGKPYPLPDAAPHLLERYCKEYGGGRMYSTLMPDLQRQVSQIADRYASQYDNNRVRNIGIVVARTGSGEAIAYIGNTSLPGEPEWGRKVDMVKAERSTGSILKPFLYGAMLHEGLLLPQSLVPDVPLYIDGFSPRNYNKGYSGVVPAGTAISRSLNVPLVKMLLQYDFSKFHYLLRNLGMTTLHKPAAHYGCSLILGGAEGTLWDLTGMYASMGRILSGEEDPAFNPLRYQRMEENNPAASKETDLTLDPSSLWFVINAMADVNRPEEEADWSHFATMKQIAWKTGTSFGGRDAWSIGITPEFTVGVWVGNASGEGRAGVTGVGYAAPVMLDVFSLLPATGWFDRPTEQLRELPVCRESGFRAGPYCVAQDTLYMPPAGIKTAPCPYHKRIFLDPTRQYRVSAGCIPVEDMIAADWFVLPPVQEWYYRSSNPGYEPLPPLLPGCGSGEEKSIELIYPRHGMRIYIPRGFSGASEQVILKAAHIRSGATIFWHLNEHYLGTTRENHQISVSPEPGHYFLTLVDEDGNTRKISFDIVSR